MVVTPLVRLQLNVTGGTTAVELRATDVEALSTTCTTVFDGLGSLFGSPVYCAVTLTEASWEAVSAVVVHCATPDGSSATELLPAHGFGTPGMVKVTEPVGMAPGGTSDTVAVNVTDWPVTEGLNDDVRTVCVTEGLAEAEPAKATA
jgi:hypothetical protein